MNKIKKILLWSRIRTTNIEIKEGKKIYLNDLKVEEKEQFQIKDLEQQTNEKKHKKKIL